MLRTLLQHVVAAVGWPTIEQYFYWLHRRHTERICLHRETLAALRDFAARRELARMREILADCQAQSQRGAAISTSLKIIGDGIDKQTAAVILQRLYFLTSGRQ